MSLKPLGEFASSPPTASDTGPSKSPRAIARTLAKKLLDGGESSSALEHRSEGIIQHPDRNEHGPPSLGGERPHCSAPPRWD